MSSFTFDSIGLNNFGAITLSISTDNKYLAYPSTRTEGIVVYDIQNQTTIKNIVTNPLKGTTLALFSPQSHYLAGMFQGSTYMFSTDILTDIIKKDDGTPMMSIIPNPGSSKINLDFSIQKPGMVKITITNLNGTIIKDLGEKYYEQGNHAVQFDAGSFTPGTYFIKMESADGVLVNKIIIKK